MLQIDLCERRGSGYDRAVEAIEAMYLPPYKAENGTNFTRITLFPKKVFKTMTMQEKVLASYQHACLLYENGEELNNQTLRERFNLEKNKSSVASRIISETIACGLIKAASTENESKKFSTYIPFYG